jgi:hypothetical protein
LRLKDRSLLSSPSSRFLFVWLCNKFQRQDGTKEKNI